MKARRTPCGKISSHFLNHDFDYLLILSGDQLYRMDFRQMIDAAHRNRGGHHRRHDSRRARRKRSRSASCKSTRTGASRASWKSRRKPALLDSLAAAAGMAERNSASKTDGESFLASMGIYVFNRDVDPRTARQSAVRFRQTYHPARHQHAPRFLLRFSRLLGRHRHDPFVFRGESRPGFRTAAFQFLRHERADFFASALSARLQDQRRADRPRARHRRLHHQSARTSTTPSSACAHLSARERN